MKNAALSAILRPDDRVLLEVAMQSRLLMLLPAALLLGAAAAQDDAKGDNLKICFPERGEQRSTAFESKAKSVNGVLIILTRDRSDQ
jgi:hypothetical protein